MKQSNSNTKQAVWRTFVVLLIVTCIWLTLDRVTKFYFDSGQFALGQDITESILGIFHLTLVHNTGAAFGMFANGTLILGVLSIAISIVLLAMPFILHAINSRKQNNSSTPIIPNHSTTKPSTPQDILQQTSKNPSTTKPSTPAFRLTTLQLISIGIVAAGGIGNAIDRFVTGYVVDFICFDFVNFPVFNIGDIGVTCGILILLTNLIYLSFKH